MMQRRAWLEVDLRAIQRNYEIVRKIYPEASVVYAVVKADGYGLGMPAIVAQLAPLNACFAVANLQEALELRKIAQSSPVMILGTCLPEELGQALELKCEIIASSIEEIDLIDRHAIRSKQTAKVHLKVDTGMGRMGVTPDKIGKVAEAIKASKNIEWYGLLSHLACADSDKSFTSQQIARFSEARAFFEGQGIRFPVYHLLNSAGILGELKSETNAYRPGLMLYGVNPLGANSSSHKLEPVVTLKSKVALVRDLPQGSTISYGATVRLARDSRVATISLGYADGLPRSLSNAGVEVLINGKSCPILGVITMDMTLVDVSDQPDCKPGDEVIIAGSLDGFNNSLEALAEKARMIPWELLTGFSNGRLGRAYSFSEDKC